MSFMQTARPINFIRRSARLRRFSYIQELSHGRFQHKKIFSSADRRSVDHSDHPHSLGTRINRQERTKDLCDVNPYVCSTCQISWASCHINSTAGLSDARILRARPECFVGRREGLCGCETMEEL